MPRLWVIGTDLVRAAVRHRVLGHAAEMSFFALLALVPATVTVGAVLGLLSRTAASAGQGREQDTAIGAVRLLIGPELADTVVGPFVRAQLTQPRGGLAVGGLVVTWWLFSHLFTATAHALDVAYGVTDRRRSHVQRLIALASVVGTVVAVTVTLEVLSRLPLGRRAGPDDDLVASAVSLAWSLTRWPLLFVILVAFLVGLYRYSPNVRHTWAQCLPGAALGVLLWAMASAAFRLYLEVGVTSSTGVLTQDPDVILIGRSVGAVVATAVWIYFSSVAVLVGAELNVELGLRRRSERSVLR